MVLMSAISDTIHNETLHSAGIEGLLTKPVQRRQLSHCLNSLVDGKSAQYARWAGDLRTSNPIPKIASTGTRDNTLHVLLAEDNPINTDVATSILQKSGLRVSAVINGSEAVQILEKQPFDLVLMDMQMPVMDGLQATRTIRDPNSNVLNHQIPIIAMTANAMRKDQEACMQAGMDDYISKPFNPAELIQKIVHWSQSERPRAGSLPLGFEGPIKPEPLQPALDPSTAIPPIDYDVLIHRVLGDREMAMDLLTKMDAILDKELGHLVVVIEARDGDQTRKLAHKLKGSAGNLSAEPLRKAFELLEAAGAANDWEMISESLASLRCCAADFHEAIHPVIKGQDL
jgi:CheY-like chemotaxis protein/HPt (histidine-containing phosphotransfer) domain-containing protein